MPDRTRQQNSHSAGPFSSGQSKGAGELLASAFVQAIFVPGLLLINLLSAKSEQYQRILITLFFTVFGFTMIHGGDAIGHQFNVETNYANLDFRTFITDLFSLVMLGSSVGGAKDIYNHVISYFFGTVIGLPHLYFPFVATVYGYFFAGSVVHVLRNFSFSKFNYIVISLAAVFLLVKGLEGVSSVRTWTGLWILVYACLKYHESRKHLYLLLMFIPPFIHFSYLVMAIPAWVVLFFGSKPLVYSAIFMASSVTTLLPVEPTADLLSTTVRGESSVQWYLDTEADRGLQNLDSMMASTIWYNAFVQVGIPRWGPTILAYVLILTGIYAQVMTGYQKRIFSVGLLTMALSNITWFIYALHNRTLTIAIILMLAAFLMARMAPETKHRFRGLPPYYQWGLHLSLLFFIPLVLFNISVTLDRLSLFTFVSPFLIWIDPAYQLSFKAAINYVLGRG